MSVQIPRCHTVNQEKPEEHEYSNLKQYDKVDYILKSELYGHLLEQSYESPKATYSSC